MVVQTGFSPNQNKEDRVHHSFARKRIIPFFVFLLVMAVISENQSTAYADKTTQVFSFKIALAEKKCQMAIWLTNEQGGFVDTIYVTRKTAQKGLGNRRGKLDDKSWLGTKGARLSVLPVWAYARGVDYGSGNPYPPKNKPLPDAITSATPKAGEFIWTWKPEKPLVPGKYIYFVEINRSFDQNKHHDYSHYRGQPSVVWKGSLIVGKDESKNEAVIIGHGSPNGEDGRIESDMSTITTAQKDIKNIKALFYLQ